MQNVFNSQDNFIFGDVVSMWEMSFVFKNGCVYVLDWITLENQKYYNIQLAGYFSVECIRSVEQHKKKKKKNCTATT